MNSGRLLKRHTMRGTPPTASSTYLEKRKAIRSRPRTDGDLSETVDLVPKVNLHYPDDYEQVRQLPSHKVKRVARKGVRGWARQTLRCLMTTLLAFSATALETVERTTDPLRSWAEQKSGLLPYVAEKENRLPFWNFSVATLN